MVQWMDSEAALGSCGVVAVWRMVMVLPEWGRGCLGVVLPQCYLRHGAV